METLILQPNKKSYALAAKALKAGELVAFPTETVYGLGGNALDPDAAKKIYGVKGRPSDNPLIVHVANKEDINKYCIVPEYARAFIDRFMPGAVTAVFKKRDVVPNEVTGGLDTVAVRIPKSAVARELIAAAGIPLCAPSANTSSHPSPTQARHVYEDLCGKIPYIIDGGSCDIGIESTIVDFSVNPPRLLRPGGVPLEEIEREIGRVEGVINADRPLCPGMKYKHYSPRAEVLLYYDKDSVSKLIDSMSGVALIGYDGEFPSGENVYLMKNDEEYARSVFAIFRECDENNIKRILCKMPSDKGLGASLQNRLIKASGGKILEEIYGSKKEQ